MRFKVTIERMMTISQYRDVVVEADDMTDAQDVALNADHYGNWEAILEDSDWYEGRGDDDYGRPEVLYIEQLDGGDDDE